MMSALGHEQTSPLVRGVSVIPLEADIHQRGLHVRFVPQADFSTSRSQKAKSSSLGAEKPTSFRFCCKNTSHPAFGSK